MPKSSGLCHFKAHDLLFLNSVDKATSDGHNNNVNYLSADFGNSELLKVFGRTNGSRRVEIR